MPPRMQSMHQPVASGSSQASMAAQAAPDAAPDNSTNRRASGVTTSASEGGDELASPPPPDSSRESAEAMATKRKRSRITQACRRCKARRARCDGELPSCGECVRASTPCEYPDPNEDGRKRRRSKAPPLAPASDSRPTGAAAGQAPPPQNSARPTSSHSYPGGHSTPSVSPAGPPPPLPPTFTQSAPGQPYTSPVHPVHPPLALQPPVLPYHIMTPRGPDANFSAVHMLADAAAMPPTNSYDVFAPYSMHRSPAPTHFARPAVSEATMASGIAGPSLDPSTSQNAGYRQQSPLSSAPTAVQSAEEQANTPVPKLSYLRPFGPSGIQPGLEQIVISIAAPPAFSRDQSPSPPTSSSFPSQGLSMFDASTSFAFPYYQHGSQVPPVSTQQSVPRAERFFEEGSDMPREEIKNELFNVFFSRVGSLFPFLDRRAVTQLDDRDSPATVDVPMLVNSICAVAARFSESTAVRGPDPARSPGLYGVPFADKAKSMLIPLLGYPTTRTVQSILLLSFHEFGLNNDGSFWMFAGICLRMAQDLGLHLDIEHANLDPYARAVNRLTWWAVLAHDRMLSLGTGRPVTIKSHEISVPPPTDEDISIVAGAPLAVYSAFPAYCRLMLLFGDLCDIVNCVKGKWKMASTPSEPAPSVASSSGSGVKEQSDAACPPPHQSDDVRSLEPLEDAIARAYAELPVELRWSSLNFRKQHEAGNGPIFLHLHLWYHCVLIMLYSPPLIYPRTKAARMSLADRLSVVTRSCLQVSQIIGVAELVGEHPDYEAAPYVNQTFFVTASAWIKDHHIRTGQCVLASSTNGTRHATPTDLLAQSAADNFALCQNALVRQEKYWLGCGWLGALASRKAGQASRTSIKAATAQLSTFVSEHEMAVFRRLAKRIGGEAHTPEQLDNEALTAFFNALQTDAFSAQNHHLTSDDLAMAYTFASTFQDISHFGGTPQSAQQQQQQQQQQHQQR